MIEMEVHGVVLDPFNQMPVIVLKGKETGHILPLWIGVFEANSIAMFLEGVETPRPMTYDLLNSVINSLNAKVDYIHIHDLRDNTFYATINLLTPDRKIEIDARPSDAINLALRCEAPIFVAEEVIEKLKDDEVSSTSEDELKEWLEEITPEDFRDTKD